MSKAWKAAMEFYREKKREEKERKILLSRIANVGMLEDIIKRCNENPNLKVRIFCTDGTRYELSTYEPKNDRPLFTRINGIEVEDVR